jgi:non-ribosomal peptide synthetase component F
VLFDVVLNVLDLERGESRTPALDVKPYDFDLKIARFDLYFHVQENGGMLRFNVDYSTKLFEKSTVELYIKYFKDIIFAVLQNPGKKLGEIEIIDEKIKEEVLADFNVEFEDEL